MGEIDFVSGEEVAVKPQHVNTITWPNDTLDHEVDVYKILSRGVGTPFVYWYGTEREYRVMVMDSLGPSLEDLFNFCNRKSLLKTVLLIADQFFSRLEYIHGKSFVHWDIKPENLCCSIREEKSVPYKDARHETLLKSRGRFMGKC